MCNLCNFTINQASIIALFRVVHRYGTRLAGHVETPEELVCLSVSPTV
jgi:hypothetical protein